jgi:type VI secretion system protein VasD
VNDLPEPITVTVYELKSPNQFKQATYNDLMFNATQSLGSDLIDKESFVIRPSDSNHYTISLSSDVKYVGIVASFRQINQATWRQVIQIPDLNSGKFKLLHSGSSVSLDINLQTNEMIINSPNKVK